MPDIIKAKIDLTKIHGAKVLKKDGRTFIEVTSSQLFEGKNGALYLDCALFETPQDAYGNSHRITQDLPRALRDAGQRGAILGNAKIQGSGGPKPAPTPTPTAQNGDSSDEDVPY